MITKPMLAGDATMLLLWRAYTTLLQSYDDPSTGGGCESCGYGDENENSEEKLNLQKEIKQYLADHNFKAPEDPQQGRL